MYQTDLTKPNRENHYPNSTNLKYDQIETKSKLTTKMNQKSVRPKSSMARPCPKITFGRPKMSIQECENLKSHYKDSCFYQLDASVPKYSRNVNPKWDVKPSSVQAMKPTGRATPIFKLNKNDEFVRGSYDNGAIKQQSTPTQSNNHINNSRQQFKDGNGSNYSVRRAYKPLNELSCSIINICNQIDVDSFMDMRSIHPVSAKNAGYKEYEFSTRFKSDANTRKPYHFESSHENKPKYMDKMSNIEYRIDNNRMLQPVLRPITDA